jgi:hypothetical protein
MLGISEGWDDVVGQPFAQASVFGAVVVDQECVNAGFADEQGVFDGAVAEHFQSLVLVGVEFADGAFVEVEAQEAAEVAGAEPGLVLEEEGVEVEFVAGEDVGD